MKKILVAVLFSFPIECGKVNREVVIQKKGYYRGQEKRFRLQTSEEELKHHDLEGIKKLLQDVQSIISRLDQDMREYSEEYELFKRYRGKFILCECMLLYQLSMEKLLSEFNSDYDDEE